MIQPHLSYDSNISFKFQRKKPETLIKFDKRFVHFVVHQVMYLVSVYFVKENSKELVTFTFDFTLYLRHSN